MRVPATVALLAGVVAVGAVLGAALGPLGMAVPVPFGYAVGLVIGELWW